MKRVRDERKDFEREHRRIATVRMQLLQHHPFWGYLLLDAEFRPSPDLPTLAATDGVRRIWYNPRYTRYLPYRELGFVLLHEIGHVVMESLARRRDREHGRWNLATDYAINRMVASILEPGRSMRPMYQIPRRHIPGLGDLRPPLHDRYDDMTAETIFESLGEDDIADWPRGELDLEYGEDGSLGLPQPPAPDRRMGRLVRVSEDVGRLDLHVPPEALEPADGDDIGDRAKERVRRAAEHATSLDQAGDVPGDVRRALQPKGNEEVPWWELLREHLGRSIQRDDFSRARPNRRWMAYDLVMPSLRSDRLGDVIIALDTSASMRLSDLAAVGREIRPLLKLAEEAILVVHDAAIQEIVRGSADILKWLAAGYAKGGGSTDHRPVFEWLAREGLEPDVFVGLTDLESWFPDRAPPWPCIWVVPLRAWKHKVPWGTRVDVMPV